MRSYRWSLLLVLLGGLGWAAAGASEARAQADGVPPLRHVERWQRPAEPIDRMLHVGDLAATDEGTVYVLDTFGCRVIHLAPEEGRVLDAWGACGTDLGQLDDPTAIAWDPAGKVYVAERTLGRIQVFNAEGRWLDWYDARVIECPQHPQRCLPQPFTGLVGIHVRADGTLFALADRGYLVIVAVAPDGSVEVGRPAGYPGRLRTGAFVVNDEDRAFFLDSNGNLYATRPDGRAGPHAWLYREDDRHADLALTEGGQVCLGYLSTVDCFHPYGGHASHRELASVRSISAIAAIDDDQFYVADSLVRASITGALEGAAEDSRSALYRVDGDDDTPIWGHPASLADWPLVTGRRFVRFGIDVALDGSLVVFDIGGLTDTLLEAGPPLRAYDVPPRITRIDAGGSEVTAWGGRGESAGSFGPARSHVWAGWPGVATGPEGVAYAADVFNGRIQAFTSHGRWLRSIITSPDLPWSLHDGITDLDVDDQGHVYALEMHPPVAEPDPLARPRIRRFEPDGTEEAPIELGQLKLPIDPYIDVAPDGRSYYVSSYGGYVGSCRIVQRIARDGAPITSYAVGRGRFGGCGGVQIGADRAGAIYILSDDHLLRVSPTGERTDRVELPWIPGDATRTLAVRNDGRVVIGTSLHLTRAWPPYDRPFTIDTYAKTDTSAWRVELYPGPHLAGPRLAAGRVDTVDATWLEDLSAEVDREQEYSARFELRTALEPGRHEMQLSSAGGARLWAAGRLLIDQWHSDAITRTASLFTTGTRPIVVRLEVRGNESRIRDVGLDSFPLGPDSIHRRYLPIVHGALK